MCTLLHLTCCFYFSQILVCLWVLSYNASSLNVESWMFQHTWLNMSLLTPELHQTYKNATLLTHF